MQWLKCFAIGLIAVIPVGVAGFDDVEQKEPKRAKYDAKALDYAVTALGMKMQAPGTVKVEELLERIAKKAEIQIDTDRMSSEQKSRSVVLNEAAPRGSILRAALGDGLSWGLAMDGRVVVLKIKNPPGAFEGAKMARSIIHLNQPVDVEFSKQPIEDVMSFMSSISGLSFELHSSRAGKIPLNLKGSGVPLGRVAHHGLAKAGLRLILLGDGRIVVTDAKFAKKGSEKKPK